MKSPELYENLNSETLEYAFTCTECGSLIEGRKILHNVFSHVVYMLQCMCYLWFSINIIELMLWSYCHEIIVMVFMLMTCYYVIVVVEVYLLNY